MACAVFLTDHRQLKFKSKEGGIDVWNMKFIILLFLVQLEELGEALEVGDEISGFDWGGGNVTLLFYWFVFDFFFF